MSITYELLPNVAGDSKIMTRHVKKDDGKIIETVIRLTYEYPAEWKAPKRYMEAIKAAVTFKRDVAIRADMVGHILVATGISSALLTHVINANNFDDHLRAGTSPGLLPFMKRKPNRRDIDAFVAKVGNGGVVVTQHALREAMDKALVNAKDGVVDPDVVWRSIITKNMKGITNAG